MPRLVLGLTLLSVWGLSQAFLLAPNGQHRALTKVYNEKGSFLEQRRKAMEARGGQPPAAAPVPASQPGAPVADVPRMPAQIRQQEAAPSQGVPTNAFDPTHPLAGYVDDDGEEEGKMDIGVPLNDTDMVAYIPGMEFMTKEQYDQALNDKVAKQLQESWARGAGGNRATDNYFESLKRTPPPNSGGRAEEPRRRRP